MFGSKDLSDDSVMETVATVNSKEENLSIHNKAVELGLLNEPRQFTESILLWGSSYHLVTASCEKLVERRNKRGSTLPWWQRS